MGKAQPTTALSRKIPSLHNLKPSTAKEVAAMHEMFKAKIAAAQKAQKKTRL